MLVTEIESLAMVTLKNGRDPFFEQWPLTRRFFPQSSSNISSSCIVYVNCHREKGNLVIDMSPCVQQNLHVVL